MRLFGPEWLWMRMREINIGQHVFFDSDEGWPLECSDSGCYRFTPGSEFKVITREYSHAVTIDEYGARVSADSIHGEVAVSPFLGDSFTFGIGVEDDETFVSLLDTDSDTDYLNLGIPGSSLPQHIDIVESRHGELGAPSLYAFGFFVGNDFQNLLERRNVAGVGMSSPGGDSPDDPYPTLSSRFDWLSRVNEYVLRDSVLRRLYLVQWARHKVLLLMNRARADIMDPIFLVMRTDRSYLSDARQYFEQELERLIDVAHELQFEFVFVILPDRHQVNADLFSLKRTYYGLSEDQIDNRLPNKVLADALDNHDVIYIDITECMAGRDDVQDLYYLSDNHFTALGHQAAAACMATSGLEGIVRSKILLSD